MTEQEAIEYYRERGATIGRSIAELMDSKPSCKINSHQHKTGRMNKLEAKHARELEYRKEAGEITGYWFEEIKFRLADKTWYTPDFFVRMADGTYEVHECKGFMRDDAAVKIKVAARLFPCFVFRLFHKGKEVVIPNE